MIRDTIFFVLGILISGSAVAFCIIDYYFAMTHQTTFSDWCYEIWLDHHSDPIFWIILGIFTGFAVGLVLGTIIGHLFWPRV